MFLLLLIIFPIFAIALRNVNPQATPAPIKNDRFVFHTRLTCLLTQKEQYHFSIIFADHCPKKYGFSKTTEITKKRKGVFSKGEKNFTKSGTYNPEVDRHFDGCRRTSDNYKIYALINHNCTSDGKSVKNRVLITEECQLGKEEACHIFVDIDLAGPVVKVRKVEHSP